MVPSKLAITIFIAFVFLFFIYESEGASYNYSSGSYIDRAKTKPFENQKVNLSVYYESLSKSCAIFIVKNLEEIFNNDLMNIVNLQLVPWANCHVDKTNNSISCQNGPDECEINSLETCALNIWPKVDKSFGLISCLEFLAIDGKSKMWKNCLDQLGLPKERIMNCLNKGNGAELGKECINESAKLDPPISFVPWVVVSNQPIGKDYENFTHYVCKAYKGSAVPAACNVHL